MKQLLLYCALVLGTWLALGYVGPKERFEVLVQRGVTTQATVIRQNCEDHGTFLFWFEAEGKRVDGRGSANSAGKNCSSVQPGQVLPVIYLPSQPSVNTVGNPKDELRNELLSIGTAALVVPAFVMWAIARWRRRTEIEA